MYKLSSLFYRTGYNVSNLLANYMVTLVMTYGRNTMTNMVWPDSLSAGIGVDTTGLAYDNETVRKQIDYWNSLDEELKSILHVNNMELEDLFFAVAVQCDGHFRCIIASVLQYDCCHLVRDCGPDKVIEFIYEDFFSSFMRNQPSLDLEHVLPQTRQSSRCLPRLVTTFKFSLISTQLE